MSFNLLALIEAGEIREEDNILAIMQNVSAEHAHTIGRWLALATGKPSHLRLLGFDGPQEIRYTPEEVRAGIKTAEETIFPAGKVEGA